MPDHFYPQVIPRKAAATTSQTQKKAKAQTGSLSLESVRHDVRNLGIRGLAGRTKIEAELSQLKSLGAKVSEITMMITNKWITIVIFNFTYQVGDWLNTEKPHSALHKNY